ncbi:MAG TPA: permease-like cell division protein FtsX [Flavobacteriales bacterium]|nr:permease-like cell division protein FtsX [Flavobacteriales bacterium]HRO41068.1 permease-like cell division protein FtsX [Flavobacteriales bacterium]HRP82023.1 permease-like cell division protein FtsX [Flavobacteriales bacterium]HRQ85892.1 permease-like cell division protein FtsX [Flavobacteriales bacterium]
MSARKPFKRYTRSSNAGTIIGITLVLYMLGLLGFMLLNARELERHFKENVKVDIYLKRDLKEVDVMKFRKQLEAEPFARETRYVTADEAAEQLKEDMGEDFLGVLGDNPLLPSIELWMREAYASPDSLKWVAEHLRQDASVHEVKYNPVVVANIDANMGRLRWIMLGFSVLLLVIAVALINNTIRLAIYSKRFLIRTMHLVGATGWFIKRPFLGTSLWQGMVASVLAIGLLVGSIRLLLQWQPDLASLVHPLTLAVLLAGIVVLGLLISLLSTAVAVRRYLRMNTDEINLT